MTLHDILNGNTIVSFYFYKEKKGQKQKQEAVIYDATFTPDQRQIACVSQKYCIMYSLDTIYK